MRGFAKVCVLAVTLGSPLAVACDSFPSDGEPSSLMSNSLDVSCISSFDLDAYKVLDKPSTLSLSTQDKVEPASYWSNWLNGEEGNPLISNSASSNHFGVGVWVPEDLEEQLRDMDAKHWVQSHGLQLSLGFGDVESGMPRMRFDYRWHKQYDGDFLMQLEVPF